MRPRPDRRDNERSENDHVLSAGSLVAKKGRTPFPGVQAKKKKKYGPFFEIST